MPIGNLRNSSTQKWPGNAGTTSKKFQSIPVEMSWLHFQITLRRKEIPQTAKTASDEKDFPRNDGRDSVDYPNQGTPLSAKTGSNGVWFVHGNPAPFPGVSWRAEQAAQESIESLHFFWL